MPGRPGRVGDEGWPAWIVDPREPPQVEEGYEPKYPTKGTPGTWVVTIYFDMYANAWVPDPELPEHPEREPK
jgi:hypothetical protein